MGRALLLTGRVCSNETEHFIDNRRVCRRIWPLRTQNLGVGVLSPSNVALQTLAAKLDSILSCASLQMTQYLHVFSPVSTIEQTDPPLYVFLPIISTYQWLCTQLAHLLSLQGTDSGSLSAFQPRVSPLIANCLMFKSLRENLID